MLDYIVTIHVKHKMLNSLQMQLVYIKQEDKYKVQFYNNQMGLSLPS